MFLSHRLSLESWLKILGMDTFHLISNCLFFYSAFYKKYKVMGLTWAFLRPFCTLILKTHGSKAAILEKKDKLTFIILVIMQKHSPNNFLSSVFRNNFKIANFIQCNHCICQSSLSELWLFVTMKKLQKIECSHSSIKSIEFSEKI